MGPSLEHSSPPGAGQRMLCLSGRLGARLSPAPGAQDPLSSCPCPLGQSRQEGTGCMWEEAATFQCHRGQWNTSDLASPRVRQTPPPPVPRGQRSTSDLASPTQGQADTPSPGAKRALKWPGEESCVLSGKLPLLWERSCVGNSSFSWNYDSTSMSHAAFFYFLGIILKGNTVHIEE